MDKKSKRIKKSTKWLLGCGLTLVLGIAVLLGGTCFMYWLVVNHHENELENFGFSTVREARALEITTPITEQLLLKGVVVRIAADCQTNVAVLAHTCAVQSKINGDLHFRGLTLVLTDTAHISGSLYVDAKTFHNLGRIDGSIYYIGKNGDLPNTTHSGTEKETEQIK